jgi:hypothetical protein
MAKAMAGYLSIYARIVGVVLSFLHSRVTVTGKFADLSHHQRQKCGNKLRRWQLRDIRWRSASWPAFVRSGLGVRLQWK